MKIVKLYSSYLQLRQYGRIRDDGSHLFQHKFVPIDLAYNKTRTVRY